MFLEKRRRKHHQNNMNKKSRLAIIIIGAFIVACIILITGYAFYLTTNNQNKNAAPETLSPTIINIPSTQTASSTEIASSTATTTISYFISPEETTKYCNGDDMDSAGYEKTITIEKSTSTAEINPTKTQIIKTVIDAATTGMCHTVLSQLDITENNGVVSIPPIEGWAGVSITMCSCKPQVEVNLLKLPGITQVIWSK